MIRETAPAAVSKRRIWSRFTDLKVRVKVLGPWMNLGFSHFYSVSKPLRSASAVWLSARG